MKDKRIKILNAALELFVVHGFHGTPTSLIANRAGVANGTLFHYFKSKEQLITTLFLETKDKYFISITEQFDKSLDLKEKVKLIWRNTIDWALNNPIDFRFIQLYHNSPYISQLTHEELSRYTNFFIENLEEGKRAGILKDMESELLFQISTYQIFGLIFYLFENPEKAKNNSVLESAFKSYWDCLSK